MSGYTDEVVELEEDPGYDELKRLVGGMIQVVPNFEMFKGRKCEVLVDEEGLLKRLPINRRMTLAWRNDLTRQVGPDGWDPSMAVLCGKAVVVYGGLK